MSTSDVVDAVQPSLVADTELPSLCTAVDIISQIIAVSHRTRLTRQNAFKRQTASRCFLWTIDYLDFSSAG